MKSAIADLDKRIDETKAELADREADLADRNAQENYDSWKAENDKTNIEQLAHLDKDINESGVHHAVTSTEIGIAPHHHDVVPNWHDQGVAAPDLLAALGVGVVADMAKRGLDALDLTSLTAQLIDMVKDSENRFTDKIVDVGKTLADTVKAIGESVVAGLDDYSDRSPDDIRDTAAAGATQIESKAADIKQRNEAFDKRIENKPKETQDKLKADLAETSAQILVDVTVVIIEQVVIPERAREDRDEIDKHR